MIKIPVFDTGYEIWSTPNGWSYGKPFVQQIKDKPPRIALQNNTAKHYGYDHLPLLLVRLAHEMIHKFSDTDISTLRQYIDELYRWEKRIGELVNGSGAVSQSTTTQSTATAIKRIDKLMSARRIACVSVADG